ncbi:MAG TPA: hypothetical protein VF516_21990 [Kofleriaceae bacterium]
MKRQLAVLVGLFVASASSAAFAWDAESRDSVGGKAEWRGNTHLFIVEKAIDLLKHSDDPFALGAARFLDACTQEWRQGLWDADGRDELVDSNNHGSHFYDPSPSDHCHTYALALSSCVSGSFDARQNARNQIQHFATGKSAVPAKTYGHHAKSRCYALGLALHYMTDVTMPYHAAQYSGASPPLFLHPTLEAYVPVIQHRFVQTSWTPGAGSPDDVLVAAAKGGKALFGSFKKAINDAGGACVYVSGAGGVYAGPCFRNKPAVDAAIGEALKRAQLNTATYLHAVFRASPSLIPPGPAQFAAIWVKQAGPDWIARHGMTSQQYQQEFDKQTQQGFCLVDVTGYEEAGQPRFAAIWERKGCAGIVARHGMTAQDYQQAFDSLGKQGFRLTLINGYTVAGQDRYAAIWDRSPGPDFVARHGMTAQDYQQAFDSLGKQGWCLSQVSGTSVAGQDRYAAIWDRKPCPTFVARHGMTAPQYQQAFDELGRQGFRLRLVSAYQINGEPAYAAIWDKSPGPSFVARHGMTPDQYQKAFDQLTKDGFRLVWIDAD